MKEFITHEGRLPIWQDDINFLQDSKNEDVRALWKTLFGDRNMILEGCKVTEDEDLGTLTCSAGYVYLGGEVYKVEEQTIELSIGSIPGLSIEDGFDELGNRTMSDGTEVECYHVQRVKLQYNGTYFIRNLETYIRSESRVLGTFINTDADDIGRVYRLNGVYYFQSVRIPASGSWEKIGVLDNCTEEDLKVILDWSSVESYRETTYLIPVIGRGNYQAGSYITRVVCCGIRFKRDSDNPAEIEVEMITYDSQDVNVIEGAMVPFTHMRI